MKTQEKIIIYQVFTRLFGNGNPRCKTNGSLDENGCGKMADFTAKALGEIKRLGATHIWYTGIIEHATQTNYSRYGIRPDHPAVVKGKAGSPYAIKDYYDVDPDLATSIPDRMKEFENLVKRSHKAGLKVIIDFVPNHVARQYGSDTKPAGVADLGEQDDVNLAFSPNNNFYYIPGTKLEGNIDLHRGAADSEVELWRGLHERTKHPFRPHSRHLEQNARHIVILGIKRHRRIPVRYGRNGSCRILGMGHSTGQSAIPQPDIHCRGL